MKPLYLIIIILGSLLAIFGLEFILYLTISISLWWMLGTFLVLFFIGIIIGIIFLILRLRKKNPIIEKTETGTDVERIKSMIRENEDICDEFVDVKPMVKNVGDAGVDPTKVIHLNGILFWQDFDCDVIFKKSCTEEASILLNATDEQIREAIRTKADRPATEEVSEDITELNEFGRPIHKRITKRMSRQEIKQKEEEEKAEEGEAL